MNRPAQAAAAAHTFFVANPGHQEMRQNLEYYQAMVGVHEDDFIDLEAKPHLVRPSPPKALSAVKPRAIPPQLPAQKAHEMPLWWG